METFYICFLITFLFFVHFYRYFNMMKKHDTVLFLFCNLRREIMQYLRKNFDDLNKENAKNYLELLDCVNGEIHFFSRNKKEIYNILNLIDNIRRSTITIKKIFISKPTPELIEFIQKFNLIRFKAFRTFSPLYATLFRLVYYRAFLFSVLLMLQVTVWYQKKVVGMPKLKRRVQCIGKDLTAAEEQRSAA